MAIANLLNVLLPMSLAQIDSNCDMYQDLNLGTEYYIYNREYPDFYVASNACRWTGRSPPGTIIVISCEDINLPESTNCQQDRLSVSLSGDANLKDAFHYCGKKAITLLTQDNTITVGLFSPFTSKGGRFVCALTAMQTGPPSTTTARPNTCDCGWKNQHRIVGGQPTSANEYPSMATIVDKTTRDAFCGASIISETYSLTAAHCLHNKKPEDLGLLVGDHDLSTGDDTPYAALYKILQFKRHPKYNMTIQHHDIAILNTEVISFSLYVGPACLPFRFTWMDFYAQTVTALGWGFLDFSGNKSDVLQEVDLSIVSNLECSAAIPDPIISQQICTYAPSKDTCLSDSGGPLLWKDVNSRRLQLVGIISYGIGCATKKPAVNTRVSSYLTWITAETRNAVYCIK